MDSVVFSKIENLFWMFLNVILIFFCDYINKIEEDMAQGHNIEKLERFEWMD